MPREAGGYIMVMTIYIMVGAIAKSAQIGQVKAYERDIKISIMLRKAGTLSKSSYTVGIIRNLLRRTFGLYPEHNERQGRNQRGKGKNLKNGL